MAEQPEDSRRWSRGVPVGAATLLALGILLLLQTTEVVPWDMWFDLWRFWPVIVIAYGVNLLAGRRMPWLAALAVIGLLTGSIVIATVLTRGYDNSPSSTSNVSITTYTEPVGALESVDVSIEFGAGHLRLTSLPIGSPNLVEAQFRGLGANTSLARSGEIGHLKISMDSRLLLRHLFSDVDWQISLGRAPRLSIGLDGGAAGITLDLRELRVTNINVDVGASETDIIMPSQAGHVSADINAGAANLEIIVPPGVAAMVTSSSGLTSVDIDSSRFPRSGRAHVSPDFETAENRVTIHIQAGASRITVR